MNEHMQRLHQDHRNLDRLYDMLEEQIARYRRESDADPDPDLFLILDIITYLNDYPKLYHHPLEEQAISFMIERQLGDKSVHNFIHHQHRDLEKSTKRLSQMFEAVALDQPVAMTDIHEELDHYLAQSRKHLQSEEAKLFPIMEQVLGDADWETIHSRLPERKDPLFNGDPDSVFNSLSERL